MRITATIVLAAWSCGMAFGQGSPNIQWKVGGHQEVRRLAYSPDGNTLYTMGLDSTIKAWRVSDGAFLRTIPMYGSGIDFALSSDGTMAAAIGQDAGTLRLVRVSDGALLRDFGPAGSGSVAVSPAGDYIATAAPAKIWRVSDGQLVTNITVPDSVSHVRFSPDGQLLAVAQHFNDVKSVSFFRTSDWSFVRRISVNSPGQPDIAFSPNSQMFVWCGSGSSVGLWRVSDGALIRNCSTPEVHHSQAFSPDGNFVSAGGSAFGVWRVSDGFASGFEWGTPRYLRPAFAASMTNLALIRGAGVNWVELRTPHPAYTTVSKKLVEFTSPRDFLALPPNGQTIASGGLDDNLVTLTRASDGATTSVLTLPSSVGFAPLASLSISSDGSKLLVGAANIYVYDLATATLLNTLPGRGIGRERVAFLPGGKAFITVGGAFNGHSAYVQCVGYVRRTADGALLAVLDGHAKTIEQIAVSPGAAYVATSSMDDLKVWSLATRLPLYTLPAATGQVTFSPNNSLMAIPSANGIDLRIPGSGALVRTLNGASGNVRCAAFTLDGTRIVAGCDDSTILVWRVADGLILNTFDVETGSRRTWSRAGVGSIVMAPDGNSFYYGRDDATLVKALLP